MIPETRYCVCGHLESKHGGSGACWQCACEYFDVLSAPETRQPTRREALIAQLRSAAACARSNAEIVTTETARQHQLGMAYAYDHAADLLRDAADLLREEGEPPAPKAHFYGTPLQVAVEGGALVIRIGVQTLAHAASYSEWANPYDDESGDYVRTFAITDAVGFANDVRRMLLDEREDGSSLLSDVLDKAMEAAVDDGSEHCEYEQRILHGQTSPLETWASRVGPVPPPPHQDEQKG